MYSSHLSHSQRDGLLHIRIEPACRPDPHADHHGAAEDRAQAWIPSTGEIDVVGDRTVEAAVQSSSQSGSERLSKRQVQLEASVEHEDGYELTAIPVVALLKQYNYIRRPGLHMMGHLADPDCLFQDMERMGAKVTTTIR